VAGAVVEWEALAEAPVGPAGAPEVRLVVAADPAAEVLVEEAADSVEEGDSGAGAERAAGPAIARQ
jgi:hypothetical protein